VLEAIRNLEDDGKLGDGKGLDLKARNVEDGARKEKGASGSAGRNMTSAKLKDLWGDLPVKDRSSNGAELLKAMRDFTRKGSHLKPGCQAPLELKVCCERCHMNGYYDDWIQCP
jgi:hypothetical protein